MAGGVCAIRAVLCACCAALCACALGSHISGRLSPQLYGIVAVAGLRAEQSAEEASTKPATDRGGGGGFGGGSKAKKKASVKVKNKGIVDGLREAAVALQHRMCDAAAAPCGRYTVSFPSMALGAMRRMKANVSPPPTRKPKEEL